MENQFLTKSILFYSLAQRVKKKEICRHLKLSTNTYIEN